MALPCHLTPRSTQREGRDLRRSHTAKLEVDGENTTGALRSYARDGMSARVATDGRGDTTAPCVAEETRRQAARRLCPIVSELRLTAHCDAVSVGGWLGGPLLRVGTGSARTVSRGTGPPNGASDWSQISAGYRLSVTAVEVVSANPYLARITTR